jgi:DNA polymerase-3 subunit beta
MQVTVPKESLSQCCFLASSIVQEKIAQQVLRNVLIRADKIGNSGILTVLATDTDVSMLSTIQAEVTEPGSIMLEAQKFYEIIKELPNFPINLSVQSKSKLEILCGKSSFKINGAPGDEYPEISGIKLDHPHELERTTLINMIDYCLFSACTDETRFAISSLFLEIIEGPLGPNKPVLRAVATDGNRLSMLDRPVEHVFMDAPILLPRKGLQDLKKALEDTKSETIKVSVQNGFFTALIDGVTLGLRLKDGTYPDYKKVIPANTSTKVIVDRQEFYSAVKRVSLVANDKARALKLQFKDSVLELSSASSEVGEASESVEVEQDGPDVTLGFSSKFLLDMLGVMSSCKTLTIRLDGDKVPGVFSGDNDDLYENIIMPMRFENA